MYEKEDFKNYLRINFDEDDKTIESFWHGAEEYICTRVSIKATPKLLSRYEMFPVAVKLLATQWYQTKMPIPQSTSVKANTNEIPFGVNALIYSIQARFYNDSEFDELKDTDIKNGNI